MDMHDAKQSIEELLEEEEAKALAREAAKAAGKGPPREYESYARLSEPSNVNTAPLDDDNHRRRNGHDDRERRGRGGSHKDRYSTEREENDEHRTRRSRGHGEDDLMDEVTKDGSDKGSANGSSRSRRRSRSPRSDRRHPDSYRQRDRGGDYYVPGGGRDDDRYRPGGRNEEPRPYDRRDPNRERSPRRDRDRYPSDRDDRRRPSENHHRKREPEPTDDERDRRTVFVQQLAARLRTKDLKTFFEQVGPVVDAQIVKDRVSGRSKGVGYVEFREEESVQKAIGLTGQKLVGIPIIAQLTEAEKNRQQKSTEGAATQTNGVPFHRLYVGNIHFSITEEDLRNIFEPFGDLEFVQLQKEDLGRSKGYGFVQYVNPAQAKEALEQMNGYEVAGRPIRVGLGNDKFTSESTQSLLQRFGNQAHQQGSAFSGAGGRGAHAGGTANFDRASGKDGQDKTGGASALDDSDVSGVNFSNYSRDALMRKLARTDEPEPKIPVKAQPKKAPIEQTAPSRCVLLKNMFNQAEEAAKDPVNWQKELEEDVKTECESKYGIVVHLGVALNSDEGEIYIKFDRVQGGENAIRGLNGRWFGGSMITAQYVVDHVYNMMFPASAGK